MASEHRALTDDEISKTESRVVEQLDRALSEVMRLGDHHERTMATERVAHLSRALLALRQARGAVA